MASQASTGFSDDLHLLLNVIRGGSNIVDGLVAGARIALAGRSVFSGDTWLLNVTVDDVSMAGASAKMNILRRLAQEQGAKEVSPTAPRALRGTPFVDFNTEERRTRRRNLPVHGVSPHSRSPAVAADIYAYLAENRAEMERLEITCGVIMVAVGLQAVTIEPLLSWEDDEHFLHDRVGQTSDLAGLTAYGARPEATQVAMRMRQDIKAIFRKHGCVHVQVARSYPWAETRAPATLALITAVKDVVDPLRLVNRGSLGFGGPSD
jgi:hypothetical protein